MSNHSAFKSCLPSHLPCRETNKIKRAMSSVFRRLPAPPISMPSGRQKHSIFSMPSGSKRRGVRYSNRFSPVRRFSAAHSMFVPAVLYIKHVPGLYLNSCERKFLIQSGSFTSNVLISVSWPQDIVSRSRTVQASRFSLGFSGILSGNSSLKRSSRDSAPSWHAKPMAVEVSAFVKENIMCGDAGLYGFHQPSAHTLPWRSSIMLCSSSPLFSARSINFNMPSE